MTTASIGAARGPTVRDLQAMAAEAAAPRTRRRRSPSRAARLYLVDQLSRAAIPSLAFVAGVSLLLSVLVGRTEPVRTGLWLALVFAALFVARGLAGRFRGGQAMASRPFSWAASYTAASAVLSTAFGAAALLLVYETSSRQLALETLSVVSLSSLAVSAAHAPVARAAVAWWAPASALCILGAWRFDGPGLAIFGAAAMAAAGAAALYLWRRTLVLRAARRYPRTGPSRRGEDVQEFEAPEDFVQTGAIDTTQAAR